MFSGVDSFVQFAKVHHEGQFYEVSLNLEQWFRRRCRLRCFLSRSRALVAPLSDGAEPLEQFG